MVDRFLGSGFYVDSQGHFLTCKHVLQELKPGQCPAIGQPFGEAKDRYIPVVESTIHPTLDMAVGTAKRSSPSQFLPPHPGTLFPVLMSPPLDSQNGESQMALSTLTFVT